MAWTASVCFMRLLGIMELRHAISRLFALEGRFKEDLFSRPPRLVVIFNAQRIFLSFNPCPVHQDYNGNKSLP